MKFNNIAEIFSLIVLAVSFIGLAVIVLRKIPVLARISETGRHPQERNAFLGIFNKARNISVFKNFSLELFLHKILSRFRVLILKTDAKTSHWIQQLRERAKKRQTPDNYWQEIRKLTTRRKNKTNLPE